MRQKILLTLITLIITIPIFGQSNYTKRVAILETIDKEGRVPYAVKLMIRSNLAQAITATSNYEGYDRVDVASIMDEQEFQRTGLVDDSQIKKLGEMNGAQFILISEVVMLDEQNLYIAAKILDVESAQIVKTVNAGSAIMAVEVQKMCKTMSEELFGDKFEIVRLGLENRKVAILEIVDRADALEYGIKFMLRSNIAWAITAAPGYDGYDRVDVSSIIKEHEFQRTGLVSNQQIKRLGEMAGAQYILIAEAAQVDSNTLFLTANILDVETARIERSANTESGTLHSDIKGACVLLAKELLGIQEVGDGIIVTNEMSAEQLFTNAERAYSEENYVLSFELYERAAKMGNIPSYFGLAMHYELGRGTQENYDKAIECYEKAHNSGFMRNRSISRIVACLAKKMNRGWDVPDLFKNINYLKKYAKYTSAKGEIGFYYYFLLINIPKYRNDEKVLSEMINYLKESAEQGFAKSQYYLACCYSNGWGVKKSKDQYKYWLQKAAENGYASASVKLNEL